MFTNLMKLSSKAIQNQIMASSGKLPKLERVVYEVTDACNSKCMHCNIWRSKPTKNPLTPDEVKSVFTDPLFRDVTYMIITGGEAFIRNDLDQIILAIHEVLPNVRMTLSTNALLPERVIDVVKKILPYNLKFDVGISLDGIGKKHDEIRGIEGNFNKVNRLLEELNAMRKGHESRFDVTVAHTLSKHTADSVLDASEHAKKYNVGFLTQLCEEFSYYDNVSNMENKNNDDQIQSVRRLPPSIHNEILIKALKYDRPVNFKCFSLRTYFLLRCNGDIAPCLRYSNHGIGNVRESSPTEIWLSSAANREREIVRQCQGCSNTWATSWSFNEWFLSFFDVAVRYKIKKLRNYTNGKKN
jgi:MoaA/NifB/PqqE/SkfB family radical SAM enzyme